VKDLVAKFDDGVPVKPLALFLEEHSDSTLSDLEDPFGAEDSLIANDSFLCDEARVLADDEAHSASLEKNSVNPFKEPETITKPTTSTSFRVVSFTRTVFLILIASFAAGLLVNSAADLSSRPNDLLEMRHNIETNVAFAFAEPEAALNAAKCWMDEKIQSVKNVDWKEEQVWITNAFLDLKKVGSMIVENVEIHSNDAASYISGSCAAFLSRVQHEWKRFDFEQFAESFSTISKNLVIEIRESIFAMARFGKAICFKVQELFKLDYQKQFSHLERKVRKEYPLVADIMLEIRDVFQANQKFVLGVFHKAQPFLVTLWNGFLDFMDSIVSLMTQSFVLLLEATGKVLSILQERYKEFITNPDIKELAKNFVDYLNGSGTAEAKNVGKYFNNASLVALCFGVGITVGAIGIFLLMI
jgi:hypothetical protein